MQNRAAPGGTKPSASSRGDFHAEFQRLNFNYEMECEREWKRRREWESSLHAFCQDCSSQAEQEPLCDFCRNIRLRHLTICLRKKLFGFKIELGDANDNPGGAISRIVSNTGCAFCSLLTKAIHSYFVMYKKHGEDEEGMRANTNLDLWLRQEKGDCRLFLKFRTSVNDGCIEILYREPSNDWKPDIREQVKWSTVQQWIDQCTRHHRCTRSEVLELPQGFRLIDVGNRNLVSDFPSGSKLGRDIRFVALSYVWGKPDISKTDCLLSSNKHELTAPGGLGKLSLPKAIEDAITVCQQLHQPFLWVDRLCIHQDDDGPEKQSQINAMGKIYSSAEFTIIHASGASMEDPIAGVTTARKVFQSRTVVCGLEYILGYPDIGVSLRGSEWNERGWTYQEAVLSRRKLFFTPFELWFECSDTDDAYKREEQCSRRRVRSHTDDLGEFRVTQYKLNGCADRASIFHDFVRHLELFTARSLTHQSDILNAFMGILTTLYEGDPSIYGLPEADFDQALLWYCETKRRPAVGASSFPSWSWPSVPGTITAPTIFIGHEFRVTLVQWYYQNRNGEVKIVKSKNNLNTQGSLCLSPQAHLLVAWWKGCVEPAIPEYVRRELENCPAECERSYQIQLRFMDALWGHIQNNSYCAICESQISRRWSCPGDIWEDIQRARNSRFEGTQHFTTGSQEEEQQLIQQLHPGVLLTRAQTTCYKVSKIITQHQDPRVRTTKQLTPAVRTEIYLEDSGGQKIGKIRHECLATGGDEFLVGSKQEASKTVSFECMGISLSNGQTEIVRWTHEPKVNVLIIRRKEGSPFWRRIAVGWVYLEDWIKADRTFKTIGLE